MKAACKGGSRAETPRSAAAGEVGVEQGAAGASAVGRLVPKCGSARDGWRGEGRRA